MRHSPSLPVQLSNVYMRVGACEQQQKWWSGWHLERLVVVVVVLQLKHALLLICQQRRAVQRAVQRLNVGHLRSAMHLSEIDISKMYRSLVESSTWGWAVSVAARASLLLSGASLSVSCAAPCTSYKGMYDRCIGFSQRAAPGVEPSQWRGQGRRCPPARPCAHLSAATCYPGPHCRSPAQRHASLTKLCMKGA